jgi:alpha-amylase/alpha-mannosidase (GH57 family)
MERYICIHGHFYQPPRENPWLEEVELQEDAYPYHDWNERITAECYAPNAASRMLDSEDKIIDIVNTYSKISFDFGPTLLSWLERHKPHVHKAVVEADRLSMERFSGHGSAIAHVYNHIIMPLANRRDRYTQIIWGIKDFQKRFSRFPEGMWLPETAADIETLEALVNLGIKFTILSPRQAKRISKIEEPRKWQDVSGQRVDPTMAYLCKLPSGRSINIFFYDGPMSGEVSFGELLKNGETFAGKLIGAFNDQRKRPQIVHIATDGETFGHHHRFGDMALSYCLHYIEANNLAKITNYGEYLEKHPPTHIVEIFENSSWSCVHGVERWRNNCGCHSGKHPGWTQEWRKPLRNAMNWLRDKLIPIYEKEASKYFKNPWNARDDYIEVILDRSRENVEDFLKEHAAGLFSGEDKIRALKLLEIQRNAMLMYTSCGWFFDDISGIEAVQIMNYASKAMQYAEELMGLSLESEYLKFFEKTPSNVFGTAAMPYELFVKHSRSDLLRVAAHYAMSSIFEEYPTGRTSPQDIKIFCYTARSDVYDKAEAGKLKLVIGKANIVSDITWDEKTIGFAVLHLGDHNINAGTKDFTGDGDFSVMQAEIKEAFEKGDIPGVIRLMNTYFDSNIYSLWHLFKDEQRKVLNEILKLTYDGIETSYRQIYDNNYAIMNFFDSLNIPLPRPFSSATEYVLNTDLKRIFEREDLDMEKLKRLIDEAKRWSVKIDKVTIGFVAGGWVNSVMEKLNAQSDGLQLIENIYSVMEILKPLSLQMDLWKAQNVYFSIAGNFYGRMQEMAGEEDDLAGKWTDGFSRLGYHLNVKI